VQFVRVWKSKPELHRRRVVPAVPLSTIGAPELRIVHCVAEQTALKLKSGFTCPSSVGPEYRE
jgi:hypothetical protein